MSQEFRSKQLQHPSLGTVIARDTVCDSRNSRSLLRRCAITPEITYIFVARLNSRWESFLVIPREELYDQYETYQAGSLTKAGQVSFYFSYTGETVTCSKRDFSTYLNNWSAWPVIEH